MSDNSNHPTKEDVEILITKQIEYLKKIEEIEGKNSNYIKELSNLALLQLEIEQYSKAEENYFICLKHFEKQKDRIGQAAVLGVLGTLNHKRGDYQSAIELYDKAYKIYEELNQIEELITCLKGIGNSLIKLNHLDEATDVFLDGCAICSDNHDIYNFLDCLGNLVYIHETLEKWDVVFELYKKTLRAFKKIQDERGIINTYFNLGILQKKNEDYEEASRYFKKGTNQAIDSNYAELIIKGLGYVGESLFYIGRMKEAKNQFIKALHLAEKIAATNAILQTKILLKSLGLSDKNIIDELTKYRDSRKEK